MAENLIGRPRLSGVIRESPDYQTMGTGLTSSILLIGHADGIAVNDPYQVSSIQDAINLLEADQDSPLLRALLEVYTCGARDIWIVAAAPMSEYVSDIDQRFTQQFYSETASPATMDFYEKYYERLTSTYELLNEYEIGHLVIPVEAVFYDSGDVDFAAQLIDFCANSFETNGVVKIGFLGTRIPSTTEMSTVIADLSDRTRIDSYGVESKFLCVFDGEGIISVPQFSNTYRAPIVHQVAANAAVLPVNRAVPYVTLPVTVNIARRDLTSSEIDSLLAAQINPAIRNARGRRGAAFNVVPVSDNTMGNTGTDYWSLSQMRLVMKCANTIRVLGYKAIGTTDLYLFRKNVYEYLDSMVRSGGIKTFTLNIERSTTSLDTVYVDVGLTPYFGVRQIYFTVEAGPGA